jgi:SAM-dependent methyltransferase
MSKLRKMAREAGPRLRRLLGRQTFEDARGYVGTDTRTGEVQLQLLQRNGLEPTSKVLDVGCGFLNAGRHIMRFLEPGHFVGIDPNEWLREMAMDDPEVRQLVEERRPIFLSVDDFDASSLGIEFDYVLSHSILSHVAHWQLAQFLTNVGKVLAPEGRIVASLRLAEGNRWGSRGSKDGDDTRARKWCYPISVFFKKSTVLETAEELGLVAHHVPLYTELMNRVSLDSTPGARKGEFHDWFVFTNQTSTTPAPDGMP